MWPLEHEGGVGVEVKQEEAGDKACQYRRGSLQWRPKVSQPESCGGPLENQNLLLQIPILPLTLWETLQHSHVSGSFESVFASFHVS